MIRVTLIGPDGSGKSAVTERLVKTMPVPVRRIYMGVNPESSNIMLPTSRLQLAIRRWLGLPTDSNGPRHPQHVEKTSGGFLKRTLRFIKSVVRTTNLVAEECFRLVVIRWWLFRGIVVIQDRDFFVDYYEYDVADNGRPRSLCQCFHGWFLRSLYSKPHLTILLDVSAETMLARKQEGTAENLGRRLLHYRELVSQMPAHAVVNAEGLLDDVTTLCRDSILSFQQRRRANCADESAECVAQPPVIIIGLDCVTGLQTARNFSQIGIRVIGMASRINHFCCRTNAVETIHECETSGAKLVKRLLSLRADFGRRPVLVPCTDLSVLTISKHQRELLPWYSFVLPEPELLETLIDKVRFARFAAANSFKVPRTCILKSHSDAEQAADDLSFPVFLKPALKTAAWEANTKLKAIRVDSAAELVAAWNQFSQFSDSLIAQEYIPGDVEDCFTVNTYFDRNSNPVCSYTSQKVRQWPPGFGTASLARQSDNATVISQTLDFFRHVRYTGLGYLEFKRDHRTGDYLIIEPNVGRPTGRSAMAEASGVPLLYCMYCDAAEIRHNWAVAAVQKPQQLIWVHLRRDIQAAVYAWKRGQLTLRGWLKSLGGPKIYAVANRKDLRPFLEEIRTYLCQWLRSRVSRIATKSGSLNINRQHSVPGKKAATVLSPGKTKQLVVPYSVK